MGHVFWTMHQFITNLNHLVILSHTHIDEDQREYQPKRCNNNNKEDNSLCLNNSI